MFPKIMLQKQMISKVSASDWTSDIKKTVGPPYDISL